MRSFTLPTPYPDELGYSVIARYLAQWHYSRNDKLLYELFGQSKAMVDPTTPPRLARLAVTLGFPNARTFASRHTLLPYYLAFTPPKDRRRIARALFTDESAVASKEVRSLTFRCAEPRTFRFCADCMRRDLVVYGETYWHRAHHLPGVLRCIRHRVLLRDSHIPFRGERPDEYWAATWEALMPSRTKRLTPQMNGTLAEKVATRSLLLLSTGLSMDEFVSWAHYREMLRQLDYTDGTGRISASRFEDDLLGYLADNDCDPEKFGLDSWWLQITRRSSRQYHVPVQHLLVQAFIADRRIVAPTQMSIAVEAEE